jgi:hypothetical protein
MQVDQRQIHHTKRRMALVHINNVQLPQEEDVKYLGLHLDRRLTWHKERIIVTKMY